MLCMLVAVARWAVAPRLSGVQGLDGAVRRKVQRQGGASPMVHNQTGAVLSSNPSVQATGGMWCSLASTSWRRAPSEL